MQKSHSSLPPMNLFGSLIIFGTAGCILYAETHFLIPWLAFITGYEPIVFWFVIAGAGIFLPMLIVALIILNREGLALSIPVWRDRMRFRKMNSVDWLWSLSGIISTGIVSGVVIWLLNILLGSTDHQPPFMRFEPLTHDRCWILLLWLPYWILNIMGEEILWRGIILPRQEVSFGKSTWLIHAILWGIFHIAFGWKLVLTIAPILFIQSYIVQRRQNTWVGVVIHAGVNGPSFLAISFGLL